MRHVPACRRHSLRGRISGPGGALAHPRQRAAWREADVGRPRGSCSVERRADDLAQAVAYRLHVWHGRKPTDATAARAACGRRYEETRNTDGGEWRHAAAAEVGEAERLASSLSRLRDERRTGWAVPSSALR